MCTYLSSKINSVLLSKYVQYFSVDAICSSLVLLQERKKELTTWCLENIVKPWFLLKDSTNSKLSHQTTWSHSWKNYGLTSYCFFFVTAQEAICKLQNIGLIKPFVSQGIKKKKNRLKDGSNVHLQPRTVVSRKKHPSVRRQTNKGISKLIAPRSKKPRAQGQNQSWNLRGTRLASQIHRQSRPA